MTTCPSVYELTNGAVLPPQLLAHVAGCPGCRAIRAAWEAEVDHSDAVDVDAMPDLVWPHRVYEALEHVPAPGSLHAIWGPEDGQLLVAAVLDVTDQEALVVPVSDRSELAGDWDVLLDEAVLPYPAMLEIWNHVRVLREQLLEQVAQLDETWIGLVAHAYSGFMTGKSLPDGLRQGPLLLGEDDPRHRFRDSESDRVRWFTEPWRILFAAETFGGVVQGRRDECAVERAELSEDVGIAEASLARLEAQQEDLHAAIPKPTLVRLIKRLELPASARLLELIRDAVATNVRQAPHELGTAHARRRRGVRTATRELPDEERRRIADEYVAGLLEMVRGEP